MHNRYVEAALKSSNLWIQDIAEQIRGLVIDALREELDICLAICETAARKKEAAERIRERRKKLR